MEFSKLISKYLLIFTLAFISLKANAGVPLKSISYTVDDGLNRNVVTCFVQDNYGYGWVGTSNGISKFDGSKFYSYAELEGFLINSIIIDSENKLWVSANYGLYLYDYKTDKFKLIHRGYTHSLKKYKDQVYYLLGKQMYKLVDNKPTLISRIDAKVFVFTDSGIWHSIEDHGVALLNGDKLYLKGRYIKSLDIVNDVFFATCYNGDIFAKTKNNPLKKLDIVNRSLVTDIEWINDEFWVATNGSGIIILDSLLKFKKHLKSDTNSLLHSNSITDIYFDKNLIWVSTYGSGLECLVPDENIFTNITPNYQNNKKYVSDEGHGIYIDDNHCFLGTNYGLSRWNYKEDSFTNIDANLEKQLHGVKVRAISKDYNNNYLVATYDGLLGKYDSDFNLIKVFSPVYSNLEKEQRLVGIFNIDDVNFIISTLDGKKGLIRFNSKTGESQKVECKEETYQVMSIRKDKEGRILALLNRKGLYEYLPKENKLVQLFPDSKDVFAFVLTDFYQDENRDFYISTKIHGLLKLSKKGKIIDSWSKDNGFSSNYLLRIESIDNKHLWISSISGLIRFDMETNEFQMFDKRQGLSTNEFMSRSSAVFNNDRIIFGNTNGFTIVNTSKVYVDTSKATVVISDIKFQNKSIKELEDNSILEKPIEETSKIVLPFTKNSFTIDFFSKYNQLPKFNNFAYKLEGLEDEWTQNGEESYVTYSKLPPGNYTFIVKSTNNSNIWSDTPTKLEIEILPPWYLTWWAYTLYLIIFVIVFILIFKGYKRRLKLNLALDMANFKAKQEYELTDKKLSFFTSISHDLKTTATLISAPVDDLLAMDNLDQEVEKKLRVVRRNAKMLYSLNKELLEFRKISKNKLPLKVYHIPIFPIINNVYQTFTEECLKKKITYTLESNLKDELGYIDVKKLERILLNLISNAVKYTNEGGEVKVHAELIHKNKLIISVSDTGSGIEESETEKIFDRFYQVDKDESKIGGIGIGLFIVKQLANLHHGSISLKSKIGEGSRFTVELPVDKSSFDESEISDKEYVGSHTELDEKIAKEKNNSENTIKRKYNQLTMVIVEDNTDLRDYLVNHFAKDNTVYAAENGKIALELIKQKNPNIIISDVDMPVMNGYELCEAVKKDFEISHIPFIFLTGNSALDDKIKALYSGVDSYITKPFEISYVDAVVDSLIKNRIKLREKFIGVEPISNEEKLSDSDIEFVNKLIEFITDNLSDPNLNIDTLTSHFAVSRSQLNKKVKDLVGSTPGNYIKKIRLKKAYELLQDKGSRVSEVAYKTGFSDPNYFTLCFKKEFGKNPSKVQ